MGFPIWNEKFDEEGYITIDEHVTAIIRDEFKRGADI